MSKAIKIKLVPSKKDKLYQPLPDYADLHILMNKLHLQSVNKALDEDEESQLSELEMKVYQTDEEITRQEKQQSTINVLSDCLENTNRSIKKSVMSNNNSTLNLGNLESYNKILEESGLVKILKRIDIPDNPDYKDLNNTIEDIIKIINKEKNNINDDLKKLIDHKARIKILQENINSSTTDIDSLEIALKNIKLL